MIQCKRRNNWIFRGSKIINYYHLLKNFFCLGKSVWGSKENAVRRVSSCFRCMIFGQSF